MCILSLSEAIKKYCAYFSANLPHLIQIHVYVHLLHVRFFVFSKTASISELNLKY